MGDVRTKGIDSGLAMLADLEASGIITEDDRQRLAHKHLAEVYGLKPIVYDFPCLTCHDARERERAAVVAYLRAFPKPTDPKAWATLIENGEHVKWWSTQDGSKADG